MSDKPTAADEVLRAHARTVACGSARIVLRFQISDDGFAVSAAEPRPLPRGATARQRVWRRISPAAERLFLGGMRRMVRYVASKASEYQPGVIDFAAHRCVYRSSPGKAEVIVRDQRWCGPPGTTLAGVAQPPSAVQPLWLVDLVAGVVDAAEHAAQDIDGRSTRRFAAHFDLGRAAAAVAYDMAIPAGVTTVAGLGRIPVDVYVDDEGLIRRLRYSPLPVSPGSPDLGQFVSTLDLLEFGIALPSDWSRIPHLPDAVDGPAPG